MIRVHFTRKKPGTAATATSKFLFVDLAGSERIGRSGVQGAGQAEAIRLGIATALQGLDASLRPTLKAAGFLKRDPRQRERKKPGQKGARKKFAWVKR